MKKGKWSAGKIVSLVIPLLFLGFVCACLINYFIPRPSNENSSFKGDDVKFLQQSRVDAETLKPEYQFVVNTKTKKFHRPGKPCNPTKYYKYVTATREDLIDDGYSPCQRCDP